MVNRPDLIRNLDTAAAELALDTPTRRPRSILAGEIPWPYALRRCLRCWQVLMGGEPRDERCATCKHATFTDATGAT